MEEKSKSIPDLSDLLAVTSAVLNGESSRRVKISKNADPTRQETMMANSLNQVLDQYTSILALHKLADAELKIANEKLLTFFDGAPFFSVLSLPPEGKIVSVNRAFEKTFGYSKTETLGHTALELGISPGPETRSRILAHIEEKGFVHEIEVCLKTRWGQDRFFLVSIDLVELDGAQHILQMGQDITDLKLAHAELQRLATIDELTQLHNRRYFSEIAGTELKRSLRMKRPMSFAVFDIDNFKTINDTFGHEAGDRVLSIFAKACKQNTRDVDVLARFGGDEFTLLMPETSSINAYGVAERIRSAVSKLRIPFETHEIGLTVSLGVTSFDQDRDTLDTLFRRADEALYTAKQRGRDRVVIRET